MCISDSEGAQVCYIRGKFCGTLDDFFREISAAMRFPSYFGWNWAAFDECITDLEWLSFSKILIILDDFDVIFWNEKSSNRLKDLLIKYLNLAVDYWISKNIPITVYLNQTNQDSEMDYSELTFSSKLPF